MTRQTYDIVIRRGQLRGRSQPVDIAIAGGQVLHIEDALSGTAKHEIDAGGKLVTESFVNPHLHLCKVWTLEKAEELALTNYHENDMANAMAAIEVASKVKEGYREDLIYDNARRAIALGALYGNLHLRAFADVDTKARLEGLKALLRVRDEFRGVVDIQVVAFPQDGIIRDPGTADLLEQALELGADVVGGIPWIEYTDREAAEHVTICFDLAKRYNKDVSMLLDDAGDPTLRTLEMMAVEASRRGWEGRALAHHCRAMSQYTLPYFHRLVGSIKRAQVSVVTDPHTGPLHANVKGLLAAQVNVCLGQDDISDAYYPYGRNNMLEVVFLASHLLWMMSRAEIEQLYDMATINGARALRVENHRLEVGAAANLVVLNASNLLEAVRFHLEPSYVISHGQLIDQQQMRSISGAP
jgi:cytosine deaminase